MAMSGPRHFQEAEELLSKATHERNETTKASLLAAAQVHATLALVAATVHTGPATKEQTHTWVVYGVRV